MRVKVLSKAGHKVIDLNRRRAIRERCLNCSGWSTAEVKRCQHEDCPLHIFRVDTGKQDAKARSKAIKQYCLDCSNGSLAEVRKCAASDCPLFVFRNGRVAQAHKIHSVSCRGHIEPVLINQF